MLAPEPDGSTTGREAKEGNAEERYSDGAKIQAARTQRQMTQSGKNLEVRHRDWAPEAIREAVYVYTL